MATETLQDLAAEARGCTRCPLYKPATQTVFGEGPAGAAVVFVGEQPGDQEDRQGRPFVGPAGRIFDQALAEAGIPRDRAYITNAVKHFKFTPRGKRRLHKRPNAFEIDRCKMVARPRAGPDPAAPDRGPGRHRGAGAGGRPLAI
ncbi:UdgX family uracil-DNA binding protein, partial [Inquilinus limosus]|uniref:UdgX family uracil-DNA binding protein n=1 Tax=Inquilinus limosus TaxID=171674 RepID=UPI001EE6AD96